MARLTLKQRDWGKVPAPVVEGDTIVLGLHFPNRDDVAVYGSDGRFMAEYMEIDEGRGELPTDSSIFLALGWEITPEDGAMVMLVAHENFAEGQRGIVIENMPLCYYANPGFTPSIQITNRTGAPWPLEEGEPLIRAMVMKPTPLTLTIEERNP